MGVGWTDEQVKQGKNESKWMEGTGFLFQFRIHEIHSCWKQAMYKTANFGYQH